MLFESFTNAPIKAITNDTKDNCKFLIQKPPLVFNNFSNKTLAKPLVNVEIKTLLIPIVIFIFLAVIADVRKENCTSPTPKVNPDEC